MTEIEDLIRLGLRLLAEELEAPPATRAPRRRRRLVAVAVGLAVLIVAAALGVVERDGSRGGGSRVVDPRFVRDPFNYRPGGVSGAQPGKMLWYPVSTL